MKKKQLYILKIIRSKYFKITLGIEMNKVKMINYLGIPFFMYTPLAGKQCPPSFIHVYTFSIN